MSLIDFGFRDRWSATEYRCIVLGCGFIKCQNCNEIKQCRTLVKLNETFNYQRWNH